MKSVYLVHSKAGSYLQSYTPLKPSKSFCWTGFNSATIFHSEQVAREAGWAAHNWEAKADRYFDVEEFYLKRKVMIESVGVITVDRYLKEPVSDYVGVYLEYEGMVKITGVARFANNDLVAVLSERHTIPVSLSTPLYLSGEDLTGEDVVAVKAKARSASTLTPQPEFTCSVPLPCEGVPLASYFNG